MFFKLFLLPRFKKISACIVQHLGLNDEHPLKVCFDIFHLAVILMHKDSIKQRNGKRKQTFSTTDVKSFPRLLSHLNQMSTDRGCRKRPFLLQRKECRCLLLRKPSALFCKTTRLLCHRDLLHQQFHRRLFVVIMSFCGNHQHNHLIVINAIDNTIMGRDAS